MICRCGNEYEPYHFEITIPMDGEDVQVVMETDAELCKECKAVAIQRAYEAMFR